ncbi:hypothetical protein BGX28_000481 [Mortierella sp. GBA30]|nr:hypothetical protein BGX28_000481 [Mortierella sp. GBA30]
MPKIISNSIISSSDNRDDPSGLHSYYCLCSEFILVIDMELGQLPRRETDNAVILANASRMYKLHAIPGEVKVIKRGEGMFEKQYRLYCPRCNLPIAYETTPHLKGGAYTYIAQGALNEIQGVPHEDWELELPRKDGQSGDQSQPQAQVSGLGSGSNKDQDSGYDQAYDHDAEMRRRMEGNQNAAASARAFLAATSAKAESSAAS